MKKVVYGVLFLALLGMSAVGCQKENVNPVSQTGSSVERNLNGDQLIEAKSLLNNLKSLKQDLKETESNFTIYSNWVSDLNVITELDPSLEQVMDNNYEDNIENLLNTGVISNNEFNIIETLTSDLSSKNYDVAIDDFINSINSLNLSIEKNRGYTAFVNSLDIIESMEPGYLSSDNLNKGLFGSCLSASIGVGIAFVGLAALEVGSAGLATGVAVGGFIWASAEWGAACGKK